MPRGTATRRATECALSGARFAPDLLFEFFRASFSLLRRFLKVSANLFLLGFRTKMPDRARPGGGGDVLAFQSLGSFGWDLCICRCRNFRNDPEFPEFSVTERLCMVRRPSDINVTQFPGFPGISGKFPGSLFFAIGGFDGHRESDGIQADRCRCKKGAFAFQNKPWPKCVQRPL